MNLGIGPQEVLVVISMGLATHRGSWVWVSVGMGVGCNLETH